MATSITRANATFPVGTQVFAIDAVPPTATGFELAFTRDSTWDATGHLFDFITEGSDDNGATWEQMSANNMEGGPPGTYKGQPITQAIYRIGWAAGPSGDFKKTNIRITFNTARAFTSPLVTIKAV